MIAPSGQPTRLEWPLSLALLLAAGGAFACQGAIGQIGGAGEPGAGGASGQVTPGGSGGVGMLPRPSLTRPQGLDCARPNVGAMPLRRLTRSQYVHAVRDLVGGDVTGLDALIPEDGKAGAFRSNSTVPVDVLDVDHYGEAAQKISAGLARPETLVPCDVAVRGAPACAAEFITTFGLRAHRRPLEAVEQTEYQMLFASHGAASFADGLRAVVQAMLQSPSFLYQVEFGATAAAPGATVALSPYELASRLSFLLWDSIPDPTLLDAARQGRLATTAEIRAQAMRLLSDAKAAEAVGDFHLQWLGLDDLESLQRDSALFPAFSPDAARQMREETRRFASTVVLSGDGKLQSLLTAPYGFPGASVLPIYGNTAGAGFAGGQTLPMGATAFDRSKRGGLLTQASFLAAHAHANQTSPVARGKAVRESLLCDPPPPPPPALNVVAPDPAPGQTTRQRFAEHERDPGCAGCHALMDPIGFGFEGFDAIGRHRTMEEGQPIDVSATLTGTDVDGPFEGVVQLAAKLAGSNQVRACVAQQWFRFAFGRDGIKEDACSFWAGVDAFVASGFDVRAMLLAYVTSDAFRMRRGQ